MGKGLRRREIKCCGVFLLQREKGCGFGEGAAAREGTLVGADKWRFDGGVSSGFVLVISQSHNISYSCDCLSRNDRCCCCFFYFINYYKKIKVCIFAYVLLIKFALSIGSENRAIKRKNLKINSFQAQSAWSLCLRPPLVKVNVTRCSRHFLLSLSFKIHSKKKTKKKTRLTWSTHVFC